MRSGLLELLPHLTMLFEGCGRAFHHVGHRLALVSVNREADAMKRLGMNAG
jgi:hypothetical protein